MERTRWTEHSSVRTTSSHLYNSEITQTNNAKRAIRRSSTGSSWAPHRRAVRNN